MAVPAHDQRDWDFAKQYNLPVKMVVCPHYPKLTCPVLDKAYVGEGHLVDSGNFSSLPSEKARTEITKWLEKNKLGGRKTTYKLRDWVFSRQRYWGEPLPLVFCENCAAEIKNQKSNLKNNKKFNRGEILNPGWIAVPEGNLPVELPKVKYYEPTGTGESPLAKMDKWVNTKCPKCGGSGKRETNTMPQWAGSSWYYLRYIDPKNKKALVDKKKEKYWSPIDVYVGGAEHATRHLIYARFWHKFLFDIGVISYDEPFKEFHSVGLITAEDGRKMSKRWKNVINPDDIVKNYGADTLRLYEMFMGPFDQAIPWSSQSIIGVRRFLERVFNLKSKIVNLKSKSDLRLEILLNKTIKKVTEDIENFHFNTAISALMILVNELEKSETLQVDDYKLIIKLLSPFAPHITEELWLDLGGKQSIYFEKWPKYNPKKIAEETFRLIIQVDGKTRAVLDASVGISENEAGILTLKTENVKKWINGKAVKKIVFLKNKLINVITQ